MTTLPEAPSGARRGRLSKLGVAALPLAALAAALAWTSQPAAANPPMPHDPIGRVWSVSAPSAGTIRLQGWAADLDSTRNATVWALVDGKRVTRTSTAIARPKVAKRNHTGPTPGFDLSVRVPSSGVHTVCAVVDNFGPLGVARVLKCVVTPLGTRLSSAQVAAHSPYGAITRVSASSSTMRLTGWAAEPDFRTGRIVTVLYVDGRSAATVATRAASTQQRAAGAGKRGAFSISVPVDSGSHIGCLWLVNTGFGSNTSLGCQAIDSRGSAGSGTVTTPAINKTVVKEAKKHIGQRYVWGAEGPKTFDCSGLVMYSYHKAGYSTPRIAQDQFHAARLIPASRAVPGDLVFYHDSTGAVYHVGIYLQPLDTVAAIDESEGVAHQHIWDPSTATYGSFTHT